MRRPRPRLVWQPEPADESAYPELEDDHVLRLYAEVGAGSPLWDAFGQVEPSELKLSARLANDLTNWADYYDAHFSDAPSGPLLRDGADEERYGASWATLAARLAAEVGSGFGVEKGDLGPFGFAVIRSSLPPSRPEATAAFTALITAGRERDRQAPPAFSFYVR